MKRFLFLLIGVFGLLFFLPSEAKAEIEINKFGIHILEPSDLGKASELVNSSGGDWGWVTVVIRDDQMNLREWQEFMDNSREKHLIPLVRIATHLEGKIWVKPQRHNAQKWAEFLDSLNWPVEDRYVTLFNEPNHAKEWGGQVNPREYAQILSEFQKALKTKNEKFQVLNAGLDLAAPNSQETMEAFLFLRLMNIEVPGIFETLDGWASHSYPNHGFRGKPHDRGKTSIRGYQWELAILKNYFGLKKDLPVFITETGWPTSEERAKKFYDSQTAAKYLQEAFENVWLKDEKVWAITPFVLSDPGVFADFSWLNKEGNPNLHFETIKNLPKISWWPNQETKYEVKFISLPSFLPAKTSYRGKILLQNSGQSIWGEREAFTLSSLAEGVAVSHLSLPVGVKVKPGETALFDFSLTSSTLSGEFKFSWENLPPYQIKVFPPSLLSQARYNLWEKVILKIKNLF